MLEMVSFYQHEGTAKGQISIACLPSIKIIVFVVTSQLMIYDTIPPIKITNQAISTYQAEDTTPLLLPKILF